MAEHRLLKHGLGQAAIDRIAKALGRVLPGFKQRAFREQALAGIEQLELKQRVAHVIGVLHTHLSDDFREAAKTLARLPHNWDGGPGDDPLAGFAAWPLIDYVGVYGLGHPDVSLSLLRKLTPLFSAEFAIRPFIDGHYTLALQHLTSWCDDPNEHVRRLVSEGTRPRLPWGQRLPRFIRNPEPVLGLLERLKDDPREYVRRSVANNLNDISKDNPDAVLRVCRAWIKGAPPERRLIIRRATRGLVKAGHPEVFSLLGYTKSPQIAVRNFRLHRKRVAPGDSLAFSCDIVSLARSKQSVVLDYAVHFMKANGKPSKKIFKLKPMELGPEQTTIVQKSHSFKQITTRRYYAGEHAIELLINGTTRGIRKFQLRAAAGLHRPLAATPPAPARKAERQGPQQNKRATRGDRHGS